jgi:hypothetical protein
MKESSIRLTDHEISDGSVGGETRFKESKVVLGSLNVVRLRKTCFVVEVSASVKIAHKNWKSMAVFSYKPHHFKQWRNKILSV